MPQYLYLFTIAPVQTFIAQARKTHDLFAGSRILSDLVTYAMRQTQTQVKDSDKDCNFIFPTLKQSSKPNRFIAIVQTDNMQQLGDAVQKAVNTYFTDTLGKKVTQLFPPAAAQLENFLNIYWVAIPYDETGNYPTQISQLEQQMGAVKSIRPFTQFPERGRKCAVNGEYNVKFYRRYENESANDRLYNKKLFQDRSEVKVIAFDDFRNGVSQKDLNAGEGLCAISMLKRLYQNSNSFPSTARVALLDTLHRNKIADEFLGIVKSLNGGSADEQIYYESNTSTDYLDKQGYVELRKKANLADFYKNFRHLKTEMKAQSLRLAKYYAVVAFDADGMGTKLQLSTGAPEHTRISKLLAKFAQAATDYIDDSQQAHGKTVYAGGDDFLGLINLNHLFAVMKHLRQLFDQIVNSELREELRMTFSAGVAITHYKTPLGEALRWAKQMEKAAKQVERTDETAQKDALSIAVLKRSGEIHYTTWRWKTYEDNWTTDIFQRLIQHLKNGELSKKFITNLSSEYEKRLDTEGGWGQLAQQQQLIPELNQMLRTELDYFIQRATATDEAAKKAVTGLADALYQHYDYHTSFGLRVQNLLNLLHICEFIVRELNPLQPSTEPETVSSTITIEL